jgi:hypothetical protein
MTAPDVRQLAADVAQVSADDGRIDLTAIRAEIADVLGLETSPDGEPYHLLTRDDSDRVVEGADFAEEVDRLAVMIIDAMARGYRRAVGPRPAVSVGVAQVAHTAFSLALQGELHGVEREVAKLGPVALPEVALAASLVLHLCERRMETAS